MRSKHCMYYSNLIFDNLLDTMNKARIELSLEILYLFFKLIFSLVALNFTCFFFFSISL